MDLLEEIKDDLERERNAELLNKYGFLLVGLMILVVLGASVYSWWNNHNQQIQQDDGNAFYSALKVESGDQKAAIPLYEAINQLHHGAISGLAALKEAELLTATGQTDRAVVVYRGIADDNHADLALRDRARLAIVDIHVAAGKTGMEDDNELATIAASNRPWRYSAIELQGALALAKNNRTEAGRYFNVLVNDKQTPVDMKTRASQVLSVIGSI